MRIIRGLHESWWFQFEQDRWICGRWIGQNTPQLRQCPGDIGRPGGPHSITLRRNLSRTAEYVSAKRRCIQRRQALREEGPDETGKQIATPTSCQGGIAGGYDAWSGA